MAHMKGLMQGFDVLLSPDLGFLYELEFLQGHFIALLSDCLLESADIIHIFFVTTAILLFEAFSLLALKALCVSKVLFM